MNEWTKCSDLPLRTRPLGLNIFSILFILSKNQSSADPQRADTDTGTRVAATAS